VLEINSLQVISLKFWFDVKVFVEFNFAAEFKASCNPIVLAMLKLELVIVGCFEFKASSNPSVFEILKSLSFIKSCFAFIFVSNCPILVPTLVVPYTKLVAVIVGAVIFPELIVPVFILLDEVNVGCLLFKLVSIPEIFVPTLVLAEPYNKLLDAVIVGAVIVGAVIVVPVRAVIEPESIVPVIILIDEVSDGCLPFKLVSIPEILVPTLVVPYNKLGAVMLVPVLPVILPELIVPVVILLVEFKSVPPVAETVLPLIVIFVPAHNVDCLPSNVDKIELMLSPTFITPVSSSTLNIYALNSPFIAGVVCVFVENGVTYIEFNIKLS
jgi:hypothetical protein